MKFEIVKESLKKNLPDALRSVGYFYNTNSYSNQASFIKRLSKTQFYPRFHLYVTETENCYKLSLHLDQKKASYEGQTAHSGEYDEPIVKEEAERIVSII